MALDVVQLDGFYRTSRGKAVADILSGKVDQLWNDVRNLRVLLFGYGLPCSPVLVDAERTIALMPAPLGVVPWSSTAPGGTLLGHEEALPFPDSMFDRVLLLHALEVAESENALMREVWRVLAPEGRVIVIVPNRQGLWARAERTPFGHGRPYSSGQLRDLLKQAFFRPLSRSGLLHAPPLPGGIFRRVCRGWERIAPRWTMPVAGLLVSEATKQVHAPVGEAARSARRRAPVPVRLVTTRTRPVRRTARRGVRRE